MTKTAKQIQTDMWNMLRASSLVREISGDVYRQGLRPRDSNKEDAEVIVTVATASEIQRGVVTVNIFVPDIDAYDNGVLVEDYDRTEALEAAAQRWVDSLTCRVSGYRLKLADAIDTIDAPETNQHFVNVRLRFSYDGGDETIKTDFIN